MTINVTEERRAGLMTTQGFPRDLPEPPFSCRWIIDNTLLWSKRQEWMDKKRKNQNWKGENQDWKLFVYFTQLYIKADFITVHECNDIRCSNATKVLNMEWNTHHPAVWSWYPYLHIEVAVPSKSVLPSPHFRVMEVNDAFGLNITWEVEKEELRKGFFSCSLIECNFNGECMVNATEAGTIAGMECACAKPAAIDDVIVSKTPFYGDRCQFHNKHGHCTGPKDGHWDARERCHGHGCKYLTSRFVMCDCRKGWSGRRCENLDPTMESDVADDVGDGGAVCSSTLVYNISVILENRVVNYSRYKEEVGEFWRKSCNFNCRVQKIGKTGDVAKVSSLYLVVTGLKSHIDRTIKAIGTSRKMSEVAIARINVTDEDRICISNLELNQSNALHEKQEFALTCTAIFRSNVAPGFSLDRVGSRDMTFTWYKDDLLVNTSVARRFLKQDVFKLPKSNPPSQVGVLTVSQAGHWDTGVFRCNVEYLGLSANFSLTKVEVTEKPLVGVYPRMLILTREGGNIVTPRNQSSIYCFSDKDADYRPDYNFTWKKRPIRAPPDQDTYVDFDRGPEEVEDILLPKGSLLRLGNITENANYTCHVFNKEKEVSVSVPVYVMTPAEVRTETCERTADMDIVWPQTLADEVYRRPCHENYRGMQYRVCNRVSRGMPPTWGLQVNQDECVRNELWIIRNKFVEYTEGYTINKDNVNQVYLTLFSLDLETNRRTMKPRPAEWSLILELLVNIMHYLAKMDETPGRGQSDLWRRQLMPAKNHLFKVVTFLALHGDDRQLRRNVPVIMALLSTTALVAARMTRLGSTEPPFLFCPVVVTIGRLEVGGGAGDLLLEAANNDTDLTDKCAMFERGVTVRVAETMADGGGRGQRGNVSVAVIYFQPLHKFVTKMPERSEEKEIKYSLVSNVVSVVMEKEEAQGESYIYLNDLSPQLTVTISFSPLPRSVPDLAVVACSEAPSAVLLGSGGTEDVSSWQWVSPSPSCSYVYDNVTRIPSCRCNRTGTFALLTSEKSSSRDVESLDGVSRPLVYGCLIGLLVSGMTFLLLCRSWVVHHRTAITLLKLQTTVSVLLSLLLFVLATNEVIPTYSHSYVCSSLQLFLLTALTAQLSKSAVINCDLQPNVNPRSVKPVIFAFSLGGPALFVLTMSASCSHGAGRSGYWLVSPSAHLWGYVSTSGLLLVLYLVLVVRTLADLHCYKNQANRDSAKFTNYLHNIATLHRSAFITGALLNLNVSSIVYVNLPAMAWLFVYFFSASAALLGLFVFACYVVKSESYEALAWCGGSKKNLGPGAEGEFRLKESRGVGSSSRGSSSRGAGGSSPGVSRPPSLSAARGCTTPLIQQQAADPWYHQEEDSETSHHLTFSRHLRMSPSDIQELARQASLSSGSSCAGTGKGSCSHCLNHAREFKKPARAKCRLRDNPDSQEEQSKTPPESLSEVIERMTKKPAGLPPLAESPHRGTSHHSSSSEGRSNSRRSTITSSVTMPTSSDVSEYVQQETSPDKRGPGVGRIIRNNDSAGPPPPPRPRASPARSSSSHHPVRPSNPSSLPPFSAPSPPSPPSVTAVLPNSPSVTTLRPSHSLSMTDVGTAPPSPPQQDVPKYPRTSAADHLRHPSVAEAIAAAEAAMESSAAEVSRFRALQSCSSADRDLCQGPQENKLKNHVLLRQWEQVSRSNPGNPQHVLYGPRSSNPAIPGTLHLEQHGARSIPGTSGDISASRSSSYTSTPNVRSGTYDTLLLLHSVGERLKVENGTSEQLYGNNNNRKNKVDTSVSIGSGEAEEKNETFWQANPADRV